MKQTFKMYLVVGINPTHDGKPQYALSRWNPDNGDIKYRTEATVREVEIEVDVPDTIDLTDVKIKALEEALQADRAESQVRHNTLMDQISKLKCLTHECADQ
jgi:hypothetical protein